MAPFSFPDPRSEPPSPPNIPAPLEVKVVVAIEVISLEPDQVVIKASREAVEGLRDWSPAVQVKAIHENGREWQLTFRIPEKA
jgi:hypothetical protein